MRTLNNASKDVLRFATELQRVVFPKCRSRSRLCRVNCIPPKVYLQLWNAMRCMLKIILLRGIFMLFTKDAPWHVLQEVRTITIQNPAKHVLLVNSPQIKNYTATYNIKEHASACGSYAFRMFLSHIRARPASRTNYVFSKKNLLRTIQLFPVGYPNWHDECWLGTHLLIMLTSLFNK